MKFKLTLIFFIIISLSSSCSDQRKEIKITENQLGVCFSSSAFKILEPGKHFISPKDHLTLLNSKGSLKLQTFDVLSYETKSLLCNVVITYELAPNQIKNIVNTVIYVDFIDDFEELLILPELRSVIRETCFSELHKHLLNSDHRSQGNISRAVNAKLKDYVSIKSLKVQFTSPN